ncbi:S-layer homology domain-containing protein [Paenibacillus chartarius]|uniref:S-layer homology domain-containing protein n=1 Tax=Paenibacillus chartarius TaxID=747481 RepID=A0ABV6DG52_9BACL
MKALLFRLTLAGLLLLGSGAALSAPSPASAERFNMSYVYFGISNNYIEEVDAANGALQTVAPNYFELNADGTLRLTPKAESTFTRELHARGLKVVPYLTNDWSREVGRLALQQREKLSGDIAAAVARLGVDGIDVDIENVTEADREAFTDFIRLLRQKLPADKAVSVAVAPNPYGAKTGWAAAYDYRELARYADYMMIMAYDESYPGDPTPGPVASLGFVEASVQAALKQVPSDKIVLGVPFYGRLWKDGDSTFDGSGLSNAQAETFIARYDGRTEYDEKQGAMKAAFTVEAGDPVSKVTGRTLTPGSYTIWYENDRSLQTKLQLVGKYNLKGTGSWSLGQESNSTWSYYSLWLNGAYFSDIAGHWAEQDIRTAAANNWMTGSSASLFVPDRALTRAEAAAVLVRALGLSGDAAAGNGAAAAFADVPAAHWAARDIEAAARAGLVEGVAAGRFAPDKPLTREQMCALLVRALKLSAVEAPAGSKLAFRDVPAGSWSAPAIAALSAKGVVDGYGDGTFRPQASVTRAHMAALLVRLESSLSPKAETGTDTGSVSP